MAHTIDLTGEDVPSTSIQTLTDANKSYRLVIPRECGAIAVQPNTTAILVSYNGTEGATLAAYMSMPADSLIQWPLYPATSPLSKDVTFYLETASAGATVSVSLLPRDGIYPA